MRGLASFTRSTALSNGMDAQRSAGVLLSSPAAAQRCAEGAGLDSGAPAEAQSAMPSIALPCSAPTAHGYPPTPAAPMAPQLQPRISTSLTDVTPDHRERDVRGPSHTEAMTQQEGSAPPIAQAGTDVDRLCRSQLARALVRPSASSWDREYSHAPVMSHHPE